jgi:competence protein ComEC
MSLQDERKPVIRIAFLDVGQGDTIVITCPETREAIVVDCIDDEAVFDYLEREQIRHLRGVIITHIHADHYKGAAELLYSCAERLGIDGCEVLASSDDIPRTLGTKWPPDGDKHSTIYDEPRFLKRNGALAKLYNWTLENQGKCEILRATPRLTLPFNGTIVHSLRLLQPPHVDYSTLRMSGLNNISVVLQVLGNGASALLMGDLEYAGWEILQKNHPEVTCDVLKFPHHGGTWTELESDELLSALQPSLVVLSVGSDNTYEHPSAGVFASLRKEKEIQLLCTQATKACLNNGSLQSEIAAITRKFQNRAAIDGSFLVLPRRGHCPCAGTVVVELGNEVRVLQPNTDFHRFSVISAHFKEYHQCSVSL